MTFTDESGAKNALSSKEFKGQKDSRFGSQGKNAFQKENDIRKQTSNYFNITVFSKYYSEEAKKRKNDEAKGDLSNNCFRTARPVKRIQNNPFLKQEKTLNQH